MSGRFGMYASAPTVVRLTRGSPDVAAGAVVGAPTHARGAVRGTPRTPGVHELDRAAAHHVRRQPAPARAPNRQPSLRACDAGESAALRGARSAALQMASDAVSGLQDLLANGWGRLPADPRAGATSVALARAFAIESDKHLWPLIGIDAAETRTRDAKDRATAQAVLANFRQIAADLPHYAAAPSCTTRLTSGSPCMGCVAAAGPRCRDGATAWVPQQFIGLPSSAVFFCPDFFAPATGDVRRAAIFLHEVAHLQPFAARDRVGGTRYYGCPVMPEAGTGPGLVDPDVIKGVADAYACFVLTQRETATALRRVAPAPVPAP